MRACWTFACSAGLSVFVRTCHCFASPSTSLPVALHDRVGLPLLRKDLRDLARRVRLAGLERDLRAALEVDAEVEPVDTERDHAGEDDGARDAEPPVAAPDEVELEPLRGLLALRAHEARVVEPLEAAEKTEQRARRRDGGEQRDRRPDQEHEGEALHVRDGDQEDHHRRDHRHDVRVENRVEALAVTGRDRRAHRLSGAHLFLDAFEHDDVRVGRDTDREDQAGEARQRQRDVEEEDRRVVEERVDREAGHRDETEEAVEHEEEERDDEKARDRGEDRLVERALAERRGDLGLREPMERVRQRTALKDEGEVVRRVRSTPCC